MLRNTGGGTICIKKGIMRIKVGCDIKLSVKKVYIVLVWRCHFEQKYCVILESNRVKNALC